MVSELARETCPCATSLTVFFDALEMWRASGRDQPLKVMDSGNAGQWTDLTNVLEQ